MGDVHPRHGVATAAAAGIAAAWIALRLGVFHDLSFPLSYALPLLVCVWTRRRWHLFAMAALFILAAILEYAHAIEPAPTPQHTNTLLATLLNTLIGAVAVYAILVLRDHVDAQRAELLSQNDQISAQAQELARQQEELSYQNEELEQQADVLDAANRAKDHFLAVLSHELRTPLTPVMMSVSELLDDRSLPPAVLDDLAMIRRNLDLQTRLIDDLLDVTRIARGKLQLHKQPLELRRIVSQAAGICASEARDRGLELHLDLGEDKLPVEGDPARLQQVFWNLIKNAIKFTPHGRVCVTCRIDNELAHVYVADEGIGMSDALLARIFQAFEQGGADTTRRFGGLGLGLAISKAIVEMHAGSIAAHSDGPGRGAVFTVCLPISNVAMPDLPEPAPATPAVHTGRILLVEDHADSARLLARLLEHSGWQVTLAADFASALRAAVGQRFDLLISDIGLPDGSGLDLLQRLRTAQPDLPGIALTGHGSEEDIRLSHRAGYRLHVTKPVDARSLQHALASVLTSLQEASALVR